MTPGSALPPFTLVRRRSGVGHPTLLNEALQAEPAQPELLNSVYPLFIDAGEPELALEFADRLLPYVDEVLDREVALAACATVAEESLAGQRALEYLLNAFAVRGDDGAYGPRVERLAQSEVAKQRAVANGFKSQNVMMLTGLQFTYSLPAG